MSEATGGANLIQIRCPDCSNGYTSKRIGGMAEILAGMSTIVGDWPEAPKCKTCLGHSILVVDRKHLQRLSGISR